jgi:hypothetical protein
MQELEKILLETRMANARLMEDNESFQLLLGEKTLNGDFAKNDFSYMSSNAEALSALEGRTPAQGTSLADELSSAAEGESDNYRRLEAEAKSLKEQNKALTLYINNIIERLLQHQDFESILDKTPNLMAGPNAAIRNKDKELPPPPPKEASGQSILQRARSVAMGGNRQRPRPVSHMPPPSASRPSMTENPNTAPSIPLGRSQSVKNRRPNSEQYNAATVVNQMYRGSEQASPPVLPSTPRQSYFLPSISGGNPNAAARVPSGSSIPTTSTAGEGRVESSSASDSGHSGEVSTPPSNSPPRQQMEGKKLRPLRLVHENTDPGIGAARKVSDNILDEERKAAAKANRSSWMGWFGRSGIPEPLPKEPEKPQQLNATQ